MSDQYSIEWTQAISTTGSSGAQSDFAYDIDQSAESASYVAGRYSDGNNGGGDVEGFISKISSSGTEEWRASKSTIYDDGITAVEANSDESAIYAGGQIYLRPGQIAPASVYGQNYLGGGSDGFITKYDNLGNEEWSRLVGSTGFDSIFDLTVDTNGDVIATGSTNTSGIDTDVITTKVDKDNNIVWTEVLSSNSSIQYGQTIESDDSGFIYVAGLTEGNLDGQTSIGDLDIFLTKYSSNGLKQWTKIYGSSKTDYVTKIAIGSDNSIYLSGTTNGELYGSGAGNFEENNGAFLLKLNSSGDVDWSRVIGTSVSTRGDGGVIAASDGFIYLSGYTFGNLDGNTNQGGSDAFVTRFSSNGSQGSTFLFGSDTYDESKGLKVDQNGGIYVVGATFGDPFNGVATSATLLRPSAFVSKLSLTSIVSTGSSNESSTGISNPLTVPVAPIPVAPSTTSLPSSSQISSVFGIEAPEVVTEFDLPSPLIFNNLRLTKAIVGTAGRDIITGSDSGEVIAGGGGKDKLTGGRGPDAFVFEDPREFGRKSRDIITDFDSSEGDKIVVTLESRDMDGAAKYRLKVVDGKKEAKDAASSRKAIIYDERKGMLYFNQNGKADGFGDGGIFAQLKPTLLDEGLPVVKNDDFAFIFY